MARPRKRVLYFTQKNGKPYYDLYQVLRLEFDSKESIELEAVQLFLNEYTDESWYIKDKGYCLEIYNNESRYVFCINT